MRIFLKLLQYSAAIFASTSILYAQDARDCITIENDIARLQCYDKSYRVEETIRPASAVFEELRTLTFLQDSNEESFIIIPAQEGNFCQIKTIWSGVSSINGGTASAFAMLETDFNLADVQEIRNLRVSSFQGVGGAIQRGPLWADVAFVRGAFGTYRASTTYWTGSLSLLEKSKVLTAVRRAKERPPVQKRSLSIPVSPRFHQEDSSKIRSLLLELQTACKTN